MTATPAAAFDRITVQIQAMAHSEGPSVLRPLGRITVMDADGGTGSGGVTLDPVLNGLPPGEITVTVNAARHCDHVTAMAAQGTVAGHFNPVTRGVYDARDIEGRMQAISRETRHRLAAAHALYRQQQQPAGETLYPPTDLSGIAYEDMPETQLALGHFPPLMVDGFGQATQIGFAPMISVNQLYGRTLVLEREDRDGVSLIGCGTVGFPSRQ
ncbi:MAG: hypothetical protein KI792_06950 [Alphaproteobacteria bacterium]|nr:hypothetical protein [Alphaproteobacteria bacterium SS10]